LYEGHVEYWFVLYKHGLWSDSFLKDYLMVLPYLKGFLYILVSLFLWMNLVILLSRVYFLCRFATIGIRALSWAKRGELFLGFLEEEMRTDFFSSNFEKISI